ncbi:transglycosylase domain-containing protein [Psychrobacillus sp. MER TA 171]|uniref:transglycosylase domain-containing protein n=1 Tax=Psychrobacillus sp. MER TA 171 TaxID=2939577 RepID=UPI00203AE634|nr:transglycosylase domain-containing protein [Psychrobacillus sp. MER TA 171]MCM3359257.1 penicillin-binding protein [Psychrobacillus sp. MER TA 171]
MNKWMEKFHLYKEKVDAWQSTKWARRLRISSSVVWNLCLIFLVVGLILGAFATAVGAGYFTSLIKDEPLRKKEEMRAAVFNYEETSEIYFAGDVYLGKLRTDLERTETDLANVSPYVIDAVLATEDEYFKVHNGIVPKAIFRGLLQDMTNSDTQTGGSTLTQQLIKNQILTNEVSYERKAKEILLAMRLEEFMSKDEILEAYLNIIPYGRNANGRNIAGIETAAQGIFNVKAKDLTLPQAAYIAGIPQAPFKYTPFSNGGVLKEGESLKHGIDRMKVVLYRMKETGYITEAEYQAAVNYDITKDFRQKETLPEEKYPWLTFEIEKRVRDILSVQLAEKDGVDLEALEKDDPLIEKYNIMAQRAASTGGYRIHTTINKDMYEKMLQVRDAFESYGHTYTNISVKDPITGETVTKDFPVQVGSMLIENGTGRILSFLGGRDYNVEQYNHATQAVRSMGSTIKPLVVYAPAIEYGVIGAGSPLADVKFNINDNGNKWSPSNYTTEQELGIISARQAVTTSQNLSTIRLYDQIKDKKPTDFMMKMGFESIEEDEYANLALSIGGMRKGASLEENTNAYGTFANNGQFVDAYMIEKIVDVEGNVVYQHKVEPVDVFSPQTAYIMTDILRDVMTQGTAKLANSRLKFQSDFGAKTGTTQGHSDSWLVGYNPNVSLGVWLGYDEQKLTLFHMNNRYGHPSVRINTLWSNMMNAMYDINPELMDAPNAFQAPEGVVSRSFCGISGLAPSTACEQAGLVKSDLFNAKVMLPTQADDSLVSSSYVVINGSKYRSLDSTPSEFVTAGGHGVSEDFIKRMLGRFGGDASKLFPNDSSFASNVVSEKVFEADGTPPAPVTTSLTGNTMTWTKSASSDVVGYRVYQVVNGNRVLMATKKEAENYSYQITSPGQYVVVTVDITGLQSGASNIATINAPEPVIPVLPPEEPVEEVPEQPVPGDGNGGGGEVIITPPVEPTPPPEEESTP